MRVQGVLTSVLFTTLGANDISVLASEMNILDMPFEAHFVKILVAVRAAFASRRFLVTAPSSTSGRRWTVGIFGRGRRRRRVVGQMPAAVIIGGVHARVGAGGPHAGVWRIVLTGSQILGLFLREFSLLDKMVGGALMAGWIVLLCQLLVGVAPAPLLLVLGLIVLLVVCLRLRLLALLSLLRMCG